MESCKYILVANVQLILLSDHHKELAGLLLKSKFVSRHYAKMEAGKWQRLFFYSEIAAYFVGGPMLLP